MTVKWLTRLLFALVVLSGAALGQSFTNVTGQAKDAQGNLYVNCVYSIHFIGQSSQPGPYLLQGSVFQQTYAGVRCDGFGNFAIRLPSNQAIFPQPSGWEFNICDASGHFCNGTGTGIITIAGGSQDITAIMSPLLPILPPVTGEVRSIFGRTGQVVAVTGDYNVSQVTGAAPLTSPVFSGLVQVPTAPVGTFSPQAASTAFVMTAIGNAISGGGGGGGGGWNPPTAPGDTLFGNNSIASSTPSFFIPGGDVSFSNGNFSVNQLHFGPNALALTNTGIATGNCLQVQGSNIVGGACGTGGGSAGVSSFNTRTGAVTSAANDYNFSQIAGTLSSSQLGSSLNLPGAPTAVTAAPGTSTTQLATTAFVAAAVAAGGGGPGGGLSGSGTTNFISKFTAATVLGNSLLSDDGTTLTYTGSGGIVTPKFSITQGAFYLESVTGALPALPGAGKNALVSGTDGWYVSNANGAYFKIEPPGTGGTGGAVNSVFGRQGAVTAASGDYQFSQIGGQVGTGQLAANIALPGAPTAATAAQTVNNTQLATTAFVHAAVAAGGGGTGGIPPVAPADFAPTCLAASSGGNSTINGTINANDTVFVFISIANTNPPAFTITEGGTTLTQLASANTAPIHTGRLYATALNGATAATSISVAHTGTSKYVACAVAYKNLGSMGTPVVVSNATASPTAAVSIVAQANSIILGFIGANSVVTATALTGSLLTQTPTTAGNGAAAMVCSEVVPNAATAACGVTFSANAAWDNVGVELRSAAGAGNVGGGVTSVFGRNGAVVATANDYDVNQITGAAATDSPHFTGVPLSVTPPVNDNSTKIATTEWIQQNYGPSGGATGVAPIAPSQMGTCVSNDDAGLNTLANIPVNIVAGDAVMVSVNNQGVTGVVTSIVTDNAAGGSNNYIQNATTNRGASPNSITMNLLSVTNAKPASSITVNQTYASGGAAAPSKFVVCIATFTGVSVVNADNTYSYNVANNNAPPISTAMPHPIVPGGFIFAASALSANSQVTWSPVQNPVIRHNTSTPGSQTGSLCWAENTASVPTNLNCAATWSVPGNYFNFIVAIELQPGVAAGPTFAGPKVVAFHKANVTVGTTAVNDVAFTTCTAANCPAGYYRVAWDFLSLTSCTGGALNINVDYFDEFDLNNHYHTGMISGSGAAIGPGRNHVFGSRLMTVAKPFSSTAGIQFTTSADSAATTPSSSSQCSSGTGTAQVTLSVERLQ